MGGQDGYMPARQRHAVYGRTVRQCGGFFRFRDSSFPPSDPAGRAGDGHASGGEQIFYDDTRSVAVDIAGRYDGGGR